MAHEIDMTTGRAAMAYAGETPWHGLGVSMASDATLAEWIDAAGMGFNIIKSRSRYYTEKDSNGNPAGLMEFPDRVVLFRNDTKMALGHVSDNFQVVQPRDTVAFIHDLCRHAGIVMSTAGVLFDGRKFWALCDIGAEASIADPRDKVKAHLMMSTACDGSQATEWRFCAIRTVCNNTLEMNVRAGGPKIKITHKSKIDYDRVRRELGIEAAISAFDSTVATMRQLAETKMTAETMARKTVELLHPGYDDLDGAKQLKVLRSKPVESILRLALDGRAIGSELAGANGTAWGWLNSVTEYVDHAAGRANTTVDNRLSSAWFGKGADIKQRAMALAGVDDEAPAGTNGVTGAVDSVNQWLSQHSGNGAAPIADDNDNDSDLL